MKVVTNKFCFTLGYHFYDDQFFRSSLEQKIRIANTAMHPALAAAKCCLPWFFSGHPHFAHLATSMHFQHEWHRSKKQEGRGWGGGWPQKWHSLEMVEDFKTVRHVGGMKGWYWQRCTLDTEQAAPNYQKILKFPLTSQNWSKEEEWQTAWQVTLVEKKTLQAP